MRTEVFPAAVAKLHWKLPPLALVESEFATTVPAPQSGNPDLAVKVSPGPVTVKV